MKRLAKSLVLAIAVGAGIFVAGAFVLAVLGDEAFTEGYVEWWYALTATWFALALVALSKPRRDRAAAVLCGIAVPLVAALAFYAVDSSGSSPVDLTAPHLTGTPRVGQVISVSTGRWDPEGARHLHFLIKWQSCGPNGCARVITSAQRTYTVARDDIGRRISAGVIALGDLNAVVYTADSAVVRP